MPDEIKWQYRYYEEQCRYMEDFWYCSVNEDLAAGELFLKGRELMAI